MMMMIVLFFKRRCGEGSIEDGGGMVAAAAAALPTTLKCGLGCPVLNTFLHGGIPCGSITELVGESGSAKTQLCLQLLLAVQRPRSLGGLQASSLYVFTENYFPDRRLRQLARSFVASGRLTDPRLGGVKCGGKESLHWRGFGGMHADLVESGWEDGWTSGESCGQFCQPCCNDASTDRDCLQEFDPCDNIFVQSIQTVEELFAFLDQAQLLLSQHMPMPVKLIVIDSIAALFRSDFENTSKDLAKRADWFFKIAHKLKLYAQKFDLAVVVTNQVVDYFETEGMIRRNTTDEMNVGHSHALFSSQRRVVPALGLSWSHCINTRLFLSRSPETISQTGSSNEHPISSARVHLSHSLPEGFRQKMENPLTRERDTLDSENVQTSHSAVLQQLELELPDSILLKLSDEKYKMVEPVKNTNPSKTTLDVSKSADTELPLTGQGNTPQEPGSNAIETNHPISAVGFRRDLHVVFAPHLPVMSCEFVVERDIIRGVYLERNRGS
eukprot:c21224_g1_i1 orf=30-1523(+)